MRERGRSEADANRALAARTGRPLSRDVLWRAAWLRATYGMGFDQSIERAQREQQENKNAIQRHY